MEELFESSIIKGFIYSVIDQAGPQPIFVFPKILKEEELETSKRENSIKLTYQDSMQIAIKNLGLLIVDQAMSRRQKDKTQNYFAIIPYPDFKLTSLTYFHIIGNNSSEKPTPSAFSILIDETKRSFLYDHNLRIRNVILEYTKKIDQKIMEFGYDQSRVEDYFHNLLTELMKIEKIPSAPITSKRRMKILFVGLDDSGKTSFLLTVDKKYSKLIGLKPTRGAKISSIEVLGATIFLWDLGGQYGFREKYLIKSQIYLYEADLIFYFIDVRNRARFEESFEYLQNIIMHIRGFGQNTPLVFILSKGDPDVLNTEEIARNIEIIISRLIDITHESEPEIYTTSIFSIFTVLRAFSSGLSRLSPNRELINMNLMNFSIQSDIYLSLFLSIDGLVLANYYSLDAITLTELPVEYYIDSKEKNLRNVFEITAPQFTMLHKIFTKFKSLQADEAIFKIAKSVIVLRKIRISDFDMFMLFLIDNEEKKERINNLLPDFLNRTQDLFLRYIS